jgi:hypothetical protein
LPRMVKIKTLILPGYSPHNREWVDQVAVSLKSKNIEPIPHYWLHWPRFDRRVGPEGAPVKSYSFNKELIVLLREIDDSKINIIAKSVGVMTAFMLIPQIAGKVDKVILCGIASVVGKNRKDLLRKVLLTVPVTNILCIQNAHDKYVPFDQAENFYHSVNKKLKVISKDRSDHNYPFFEDFLDFLG